MKLLSLPTLNSSIITTTQEQSIVKSRPWQQPMTKVYGSISKTQDSCVLMHIYIFAAKILRRNCKCELLICMQQSLHTSRAEHCDPLHSSTSHMQDRRVSRQSSKALLCLDCLSHSHIPNPLKPLRQISLRQSTCENIVEKDSVTRLYH
jgi:hypothetical protein